MRRFMLVLVLCTLILPTQFVAAREAAAVVPRQLVGYWMKSHGGVGKVVTVVYEFDKDGTFGYLMSSFNDFGNCQTTFDLQSEGSTRFVGQRVTFKERYVRNTYEDTCSPGLNSDQTSAGRTQTKSWKLVTERGGRKILYLDNQAFEAWSPG